MGIWESIQIQLSELTTLSTVVRLTLAIILGGLIGMERGHRGRAAGMRTHMLVCMGATLVMITGHYIFLEYGISDPTRLGAQVISGIGFLGVGTIIVDKQRQVRGLTTAAGLWSCACMGLAIGTGFYSGAIIGCVFILATFMIMDKLEHHMIGKSRIMKVYVEVTLHADINRLVAMISDESIGISRLEIVPPRGYSGKKDERAAAIITLYLPKKYTHQYLIRRVHQTPWLHVIEEIE